MVFATGTLKRRDPQRTSALGKRPDSWSPILFGLAQAKVLCMVFAKRKTKMHDTFFIDLLQ